MDNTITSLTKNEEIIVIGTVSNHGELILNIIGGRRRQSPIVEVKDGDLIEACGVVTGENAIALDAPDKHYLRLID